jgi:hypothetical protein
MDASVSRQASPAHFFLGSISSGKSKSPTIVQDVEQSLAAGYQTGTHIVLVETVPGV